MASIAARCSGRWQRRISSSVAGLPSRQVSSLESAAGIRRGDSGCAPVGWRVASAGWLRTSIRVSYPATAAARYMEGLRHVVPG